MARVVATRLRQAEPTVYYDAKDLQVRRNDYLVVQSDQGQELARATQAPQPLVSVQPDWALPPVIRKATVADLQRRDDLEEWGERVLRLARASAGQLDLKMKMVEARYAFDATKVTVTFSADGRVDFRPLLQHLGAALRCRVHLRQVGDREAAKVAGGIGRCGRVQCCSSWMTRFDAVGVRMAKEQELPVSAEGLAGACGRLRCCLRFEYEQYRDFNQALPRIGEEIDTPQGRARVIVGHRMRDSVSVQYPSDAVLELPLDQIQRLPRPRDAAG
jgi:cell fate regulator YaaT (PSP1 superfamily)